MALKLLDQGFTVWSCSRTCAEELRDHPRFHWCEVDLAQPADIAEKLAGFLPAQTVKRLDVVFLNAGLFGLSPRPAVKMDLDAFQQVLNTNLVANKALLDILLQRYEVAQCLFSASIAGVRLRAGTLSYAVSKAALNALAQVYALEHPGTFFAVIGLCNMRTRIMTDALAGDDLALFPELVGLKARVGELDYLTEPEQRAEQLWRFYEAGFATRMQSGRFIEIRELLSA